MNKMATRTQMKTAAPPGFAPIVGKRNQSITSEGVHVELVSSFDVATSYWRQIESLIGTDVLAAGWDWTETWLQHYGALVPHRFFVGIGPDGPCGIALVTQGVDQQRGPLPVRTLHLGTAGEPSGESACVEYNRLLVLPQYRHEFTPGLLDAIGRQRGRWDIFELNGFAPEDAELLIANEPRFRPSRKICHVTDLATIRSRGGDVTSALSKSVAAKIRKNDRRFTEKFGPMVAEWVEDINRANSVFDELVVLHQARWQSAGYSGSFASARFLGFHRSLIERLLPTRRVILYRVCAGDQIVGTFYGFVEQGVIYHYQWGLAHFDDNALSPGFVVGVHCMQEAMARGYDEVNWLAGDVRYKRDLATITRELVWAEWQRGPWIATVNRLTMARQKVRIWRQMPAKLRERSQK